MSSRLSSRKTGQQKGRLSLAKREIMAIPLRKERLVGAVVALAIVCLSFLSVPTSGIAASQASFRAHGGQEFGPSFISADCGANSFVKGGTPTPTRHSHQHCLVCATSGCGSAPERAFFAARQIAFADLTLASKQAWILVERLMPVAPVRLRVSPSHAPPSVA